MAETKDNLDLQRYEMMFIIPTVFDEDKIQEIMKNINSQITALGGFIIKEEDLGRRKLAYRIKLQQTGHYGLVEFDLTKDKLKQLEDKFRLSDEILRYLLIKITPKTEEEIAKEKAMAVKIEDRKKQEIVDELEAIKEKEKEKPSVSPEVKLPEDKKDDHKKVSLEDLDKKLDELLDDDVDL